MADLVPDWANMTSLPDRVRRRMVASVCSPEIASLLMYGEYWNDHERAALLGGDAGGTVGGSSVLPEWRRRWVAESFEFAGNPIDRMLWLDNRTYLPDDLLVKMDIASMHCGLEARSPLLDHEVVEYCASLPVGLKVRSGVGKYLLKKLAERYYPPKFVHRKKMGFGIPVADWLRGPLRSLTESIILDADLMEPLDGAVIRASWEHLLGAESPTPADGRRVWALLMYGQWRLLAREDR
jgi:asparagine synthase (glutamine-hydrolysing)